MAVPEHLTNFLATRPSIKVINRSDPEFESTKQAFLASPDIPLLIARPQTGDDVAALVGHLAATSTPLVVRAGGHDISARSTRHDAVQIDIRDIAHIRVAEDRSTARIGGGIVTQDLLDGLAADELMTVLGNAGTVGWTSWAMNGGYGIVSGSYGLGCDQIVAARVVLADGSVVDADQRLLKALRGAGAAFGVVVELEIKVYPLTEITCGMISYSYDDIQSGLTTYFDNFRTMLESVETVPRELYWQPMIMAPPGAPPVFLLHFVWSGPPCDEQAEWLQRLASLGRDGKPSVGPVKPSDYTRELTKMVDTKNIPGGESRTVSTRSLAPSAEAAAVVAKHAMRLNPEYGAIFIHVLHGKSVQPDKEHPPSVFANREVGLMIEILGFAFRDPGGVDPATAWCKDMFEEITSLDGVMEHHYFPLMSKSAFQAEKTYKTEELSFLRGLKRELDPQNVFSNSIVLGA